MERFIFMLLNYPGDALGCAEILVDAESEAMARCMIEEALNRAIGRKAAKTVQIGPCRKFNGVTYINQGSNY